MTEYQEFIDWCVAQGNEFPCTAHQFYRRAQRFANQFYDADDELVHDLCCLGIGEDYLATIGLYHVIPDGIPHYLR